MPPVGRGSVDIYTQKSGERTFYLRLRVDGHRHRVRLGADRDGWTTAPAQVALEEHLARVHARTWTQPEPPPTAREQRDPTFRAFASSWLEDNMLELADAYETICDRHQTASDRHQIADRPRPGPSGS